MTNSLNAPDGRSPSDVPTSAPPDICDSCSHHGTVRRPRRAGRGQAAFVSADSPGAGAGDAKNRTDDLVVATGLVLRKVRAGKGVDAWTHEQMVVAQGFLGVGLNLDPPLR